MARAEPADSDYGSDIGESWLEQCADHEVDILPDVGAAARTPAVRILLPFAVENFSHQSITKRKAEVKIPYDNGGRCGLRRLDLAD